MEMLTWPAAQAGSATPDVQGRPGPSGRLRFEAARRRSLGPVSFTGQKGHFACLRFALCERLKTIDNQLLMLCFAPHQNPTGTPLFRQSIAGECGIRVTGFFGFSCMVCPSR
jgi:hypothetical protein